MRRARRSCDDRNSSGSGHTLKMTYAVTSDASRFAPPCDCLRSRVAGIALCRDLPSDDARRRGGSATCTTRLPLTLIAAGTRTPSDGGMDTVPDSHTHVLPCTLYLACVRWTAGCLSLRVGLTSAFAKGFSELTSTVGLAHCTLVTAWAWVICSFLIGPVV